MHNPAMLALLFNLWNNDVTNCCVILIRSRLYSKKFISPWTMDWSSDMFTSGQMTTGRVKLSTISQFFAIQLHGYHDKLSIVSGGTNNMFSVFSVDPLTSVQSPGTDQGNAFGECACPWKSQGLIPCQGMRLNSCVPSLPGTNSRHESTLSRKPRIYGNYEINLLGDVWMGK